MDAMEDKIGSILQNPEMMQKIMAMAQSLSASSSQEPPKDQNVPPAVPEIDFGMLQKI